MSDVTNKNLRVNGVNQDTVFFKQNSFLIDGGIVPEVLGVGTHNVIALPKGEAVTNLRLVSLDNAASDGSATVQFKVSFDDTGESVNSTAISVANLASGDVHDLTVNNIKGYKESAGAVLQLVIGGAALTKAKFLLIVETLPVVEFMTMG